MNGINNIDLWVIPCNHAQCLTDAFETSAKAFTAMASDKNEPAWGVKKLSRSRRLAGKLHILLQALHNI